ncbi:MAG: hypothetical protein COA79_25620 [Planctomycetota bacterium]|nr:MAG: hypothetical protein COA79_25620 [Planctomycetota bacterium]
MQKSTFDKNKLFVFISTYCWWFLRNFIKKSKRCNKCLASENFTALKNGTCKLCIDYQQKTENPDIKKEIQLQNKSEFNSFLTSIKKKKIYHVLLMLSGGKDSAYILNRLQQEFPLLNILCLFVNNGFSSPYALSNAYHVADKLKVDLIVSNSNVNDFKKEFRKAFLNLNGQGSAGVVDFTDGNMIFEIGTQIAKQMDIPCVVGGLSWVQVNQILNLESFIQEKEGCPPTVFPLAAWHTNEFEIRKEVKEKKLMLPGSDNPVISNNELIMPMCAMDFLNIGYCSFEPEFSQMIREGKSKRKVWLYNFELLEFMAKKGILNSDINKTLAKLNLNLNDIVIYNLKGELL